MRYSQDEEWFEAQGFWSAVQNEKMVMEFLWSPSSLLHREKYNKWELETTTIQQVRAYRSCRRKWRNGGYSPLSPHYPQCWKRYNWQEHQVDTNLFHTAVWSTLSVPMPKLMQTMSITFTGLVLMEELQPTWYKLEGQHREEKAQADPINV